MGTCFSYGNKLLQRQIIKLNNVKKIALIGSGVMGIGIGIDLLNKTKYEIIFIDIAAEALQRAEKEIKAYFSGMVKGGRMAAEHLEDCLNRVTYTKDYAVLKDAEIIWEIATENVTVKKVIFKKIEELADQDKLIFVFSNTSSHTTAELAELFSDGMMRDKFLTGHGYFPFHANRLFDVMKGKYATDETFMAGVAFAEQILEKKTIALINDHHGYVTDPIFQGMGAIISWDVKKGQDLVELPMIFGLMTANPFQVLDRTGHMPYTESSKHLGQALPAGDRLRMLYNLDGRYYPQWIEDLEKAGRIGIYNEGKEGFFKWEGKPNREKPVKVYDPESQGYVDIKEVNWQDYWSINEAQALDHREATIKSTEGLVKIAESDDKAGQAFRRYALPIMLYALDLIQDNFATAADINASTKVGLRFKFGLCEIIDTFLNHLGIAGFINFTKKAALENPDRADLFDVDGKIGPRKGKPCLLYTMKKKGWTNLLGYGRVYGTPVSQRNFKTGQMDIYYNDLRYVYPTTKDRVASIIFDNPLRGNVWNKYALDQLDHAVGVSIDLYEKGKLGAILFAAAGVNMRMLGADARQFNKGWFDEKVGYQFMGEKDGGYFTEAGMKIFRFLQECPIWTIGVFGEKWGGGAEFTYFLNQRFDLVHHGVEFDTIKRRNVYGEKKNYNQPEIEYAILGGFAACQELRRLGFGDSLMDELFLQGLTATRAHQLGLSNGISEDEFELLEKAYEVARMKSKFAAPYSVALYNLQKKNAFYEGCNDERLVKECGETFNPAKNPYVDTGLLRLLNMGGRNPQMDLTVRGTLPGWENTYHKLFE
ncbi:3-hydroxyacyl-CoA dehydrogenase NAD-binding domain-containing protein [candidate division CSSED10-310 bacterium]|uniref:3-hydroxyacyl-CoA dehydrogenase NAD-binding domain-containing protein n=1 Tax=candidate division CSSED10-310 bacterium TaxID=2855610 RepID=A0ABV6YZR5_UNCC1